MSEPAAPSLPQPGAAAPLRRSWWMPGPLALPAAGLFLAVALAASWNPDLDSWWRGLGYCLLALALVDALWLRILPLPRVRRRHAHALALGVDSEVRLELTPPGKTALHLRVYDHHPLDCEVEGLPQSLRLAGHSATLSYRLRPIHRGELKFGPVELQLASPLGFWRQRIHADLDEPVRVYPNFAALAGYVLLATDHRLSQAGVLQRRRRGEGLDFHQLREYREGDAPRQIDWKASSRMRRLISREYRDERDQQILLLLDCGRRMHARDGDLSHLDHALNSALLLAQVALRQGDAVGLMTFGGVDRYLPPRKSQAAINHLLAESFDLQATLSPPDYYAAAVKLMQRQRKRSLVILISNLRDEDDDTLQPAVSLLRRRHLVVLASLREQILDAALSHPIGDLDAALTHAATAQYLDARRRAFARLEQARIPCLDVEPQALPIALINRYTELKRRGSI